MNRKELEALVLSSDGPEWETIQEAATEQEAVKILLTFLDGQGTVASLAAAHNLVRKMRNPDA